jgi:hypothetical protein
MVPMEAVLYNLFNLQYYPAHSHYRTLQQSLSTSWLT